jgi:predicted TIM-barrel fold metal-dependent hydrolase
LAAIKLYPPYTPWKDFSQAAWHPIYQFADERGLAIIIHTEEDVSPSHMSEIAPRYPRASFVAAHSGNTATPRGEAIAAARANPNVYLETCSTYRTPGAIEQLVNEAGAERVLLGTDMPLLDPRAQLGKIITAHISEDAKRKILGENARRLLRL